MTWKNTVRTLSVLMLVVQFAACGGGSDDSDNPPPPPPPESFSISTTQLTFTADVDGAQPTTQTVTGTASNVTTPVFVDVATAGTAVQVATFSMTGANTGALTVMVRSPEELGVGTYTSQIQVSVCKQTLGCANNSTQIPGSPKTITVTYNVTAVPTVRYVAPYLVQPNALSDVIIRGIGFSLLTSPTVSVGAISALSTTYVNDTEIRASLPALAAGDYPVRVSTPSGAIATEATLHVLTEPALGYAFIQNTGVKTRVIYDALRDALYVGNVGSGQLYRYVHGIDPNTQNQIWTVSTLPLPPVDDIAMLPDGNTLLATSNASAIHVNLNTFSVTATTVSPLASSSGITFIHNLPVANNGIAYAVAGINGFGATFLYKYNSRKRTFKLDPGIVSQGAGVASGDGGKIFIASNMSAGVYQYNATVDAPVSTTTMHATASTMLADKTGNTIMFGQQDLHSDLRQIFKGSLFAGTVPGSTTDFINFSSALTTNGNVLYSYNPASRTVNVYDLTSVNGSGGFTQSPPIAISGTESVGNSLTFTMTLSPFEQTLFIPGLEGIIVQPLP